MLMLSSIINIQKNYFDISRREIPKGVASVKITVEIFSSIQFLDHIGEVHVDKFFHWIMLRCMLKK